MKYPMLAKAVYEIVQKCGFNKAEAARKLGTNASSVGYYLEGNREPTLAMLYKIAEESGKTMSELMGVVTKPQTAIVPVGVGTAVARGSRTVPVISKAQAGDFGFWEDLGDAAERIDCPADITDPHAFAFQVEGDSMYPRYKHGEYVIVDTTKPVMNNDDVVVKLHDGAVMVKLFKQISGMVFLESYNQAVETIPVLDGDMVKCFKIVCRK